MKVTVENFQSIKKAEIEVDGFTVITGSNNSGKTALMRAVKGAFQNTPGTAFVRHGEDNCRVEIDMGDASFAWEKGKKKPTYEIGNKELHPGKEVPQEVADTGVCSIKAGGREIWPQIAPQFTGQVFLVDQPGSVLAEAVADVERVGKLNRALKAAESDKRSATSEVKVRRKDLETYQDELQVFEGLDDVQLQVETLEAAAAKVSRVEQAVVGLTKLSQRLEDARSVVVGLDGADTLEVVPRSGLQDIVDLGRKCKDLEAISEQLGETRSQITGLGDLEQTLDGLPDLSGEVPDSIALQDLEAVQSSLARARRKLAEIEDELGTSLMELNAINLEVDEALGGLSECPTCGVPVEKGHRHEGASA